jgi:GGDEF domain-containing protein
LQETQKYNWPISFSIGVVSFDSPPSNLDEAIKIADTLMYQVKKSGKNNVIFQHNPAREGDDKKRFGLAS